MADKSKKGSKEDQKDRPDDLDMNLDEFGTLKTSVPIDKLNSFLDENLEDKKFKDRKKKKKK